MKVKQLSGILLAMALLLSAATGFADDFRLLYVSGETSIERPSLYGGASLQSDVLGQYYPGTLMLANYDTHGFTNVLVGLNEGFMPSELLQTTRPDPNLGQWGAVSTQQPGQRVHLRADARDNAVSLEQFENGTTVQILGTADDYYRVRTLSADGYMRMNDVQLDGNAGKVTLTEPIGGTLRSGTNLRAFPSRYAPVLGNYAQAQVEIWATCGVWYYVEIAADSPEGRQRGFVLGQYVSVTAQASENRYAAVSLTDERERLPLLAEPSAQGEVLRQYLNTTQVLLREEAVHDIEARQLEWWPVTVDGIDGYMLREHLSPIVPIDENTAVRGVVEP